MQGMPPPMVSSHAAMRCPQGTWAVTVAAAICVCICMLVLHVHVQVHDVLGLRARGVPQRHAPVLEARCHLGAVGAVAQARDHACVPLDGWQCRHG